MLFNTAGFDQSLKRDPGMCTALIRKRISTFSDLLEVTYSHKIVQSLSLKTKQNKTGAVVFNLKRLIKLPCLKI